MHERQVIIGVIVMIASLVGSVALSAVVIRRLPADFLVAGRHAPPMARWKQLALATVQNAAGAVLIVAGVVMSLPGVPGQGFLTVMVGVLLLKFPGKERFERRFFARPRVLRTLNRFRKVLGVEPLVAVPRDSLS